jgi:polyferredoxin
MNLLEVPWVKAALRSPLYPAIFQWVTVPAFLILLVWTLFGPNNAGQNFGMALIWTIWWPLLPLSFVLLGRFWCAICPFASITDWVQKVVGVQLSVPPFLRRYGVWIIGGLFILISYLDQAWEFDSDTRKTGYLLLAVLATVIFSGAFFERRTFCRYACFMGAFAANYSRAGMLEVRADADQCHHCPTQDCYRGTARAPGCPVFLFAPTVYDSGTCQLCANCVKNCPRDAIRVSIRKPATELWNIPRSHVGDAVLAAIVAGVVLIELFGTMSGWNGVMVAAGALLHINPYSSSRVLYAVLLAAFVAVPLAGLALASLGSQALGGNVSLAAVKRNFSLFGYAVIPVALAGHVAYCLGGLLSWSRSLPYALAATVGWFPGDPSAAWLPMPTVLWIEAAVLALGGAVSLYAGFRLARRQADRAPWAAYAPHLLLLLCLLVASLYPIVARMRQF